MQLQELDGAGAYVLLVRIDRPVRLRSFPWASRHWRRVSTPCGSAYGPGGLRARLDRHRRRRKPLHWHIDHLTAAGRIVGIGVAPGGNECDLVSRIGPHGAATTPLPGFGSSDCRRCPAHLAAVAADFDMDRCGMRSIDMATAA